MSSSNEKKILHQLQDLHDSKSITTTSKNSCHYCKIPLKTSSIYYQRPLYLNVQTFTYEFPSGADQIWGHPACFIRELLSLKGSRMNQTLHVIHDYIRNTYSYYRPIIASPPRELLTSFLPASSSAPHLTPQQYCSIVEKQELLVSLEYEPFFVPL